MITTFTLNDCDEQICCLLFLWVLRFIRFDENFNEPHEEKAPLGADGEPSAEIAMENVESKNWWKNKFVL